MRTSAARGTPAEREMHLEVAARETLGVGAARLPALRVEERSPDGDLSITRWFARDVGLARLRLVARSTDGSADRTFEIALLEHEAPRDGPRGP